ncbi:MAG: YraN family protein [Spirochaetae bacterium HGW-Spirochaetae-9]|nr:MAG: YraN family protein [Spirochaetae bacterium HGW-Spirochaetae-9]
MDAADSTSAFGREGEELAGSILEDEGWTIIARNFRAGRGEVDLVAMKGGLLSFIEVKRWSRNGSMDLHNSIGRGKIRRIIETSKIFLSKYRQYSGKKIRYDVFLLSPDRQPKRYEGAFDETV